MRQQDGVALNEALGIVCSFNSEFKESREKESRNKASRDTDNGFLPTHVPTYTCHMEEAQVNEQHKSIMVQHKSIMVRHKSIMVQHKSILSSLRAPIMIFKTSVPRILMTSVATSLMPPSLVSTRLLPLSLQVSRCLRETTGLSTEEIPPHNLCITSGPSLYDVMA